MQKKEFYITTSIAYTNAAPHIGYAFELILADVLARYYKAEGKDVFLLTGTDEHGKKIQDAAEVAGKSPQEYVDEISVQFKNLAQDLNISHDFFIRTSDEKKHIPVVLDVLKKLMKSDDIYKGKYEGLYCVGCEAFLNEAETEDGKCKIHQKDLQKTNEENYFFRFSTYASEVKKAIEKDKIVILPAYRKKEVLNFFTKEGIKDISISRSASHTTWGVTIPNDDTQIAYVWVDALLNYISAIDFGSSDFAHTWPADIHVIGKDIMRFHIMMWPALLLALGLDLPHNVYVHGFISTGGQKMSKSLGNVVAPQELLNRYSVEATRYLLLSEIPSGEDGDFSFEKFDERYTADLQNNIGNLVSRLTTIGEKNKITFGGIEIASVLNEQRKELYGKYQDAFGVFELHRALEQIILLAHESNKLIEKSKLWKLVQNDVNNAVLTMHELVSNLYVIACMLIPYMPKTAEKIFLAIGIKTKDIHDSSRKKITFQKPKEPLFPPLES